MPDWMAAYDTSMTNTKPAGCGSREQYSLLAEYSTEPRVSSGRRCRSWRRPVWSRLQK